MKVPKEEVGDRPVRWLDSEVRNGGCMVDQDRRILILPGVIVAGSALVSAGWTSTDCQSKARIMEMAGSEVSSRGNDHVSSNMYIVVYNRSHHIV